MSNIRLQRINRELADCANDTESDISIQMIDGTRLTQDPLTRQIRLST